MTRVYLEDVKTGGLWTSAPFSLSAEEIIEFGKKYDPQPMHTDLEAAKDGPFRGLIASGWQLAALAMRASVEARLFGSTPIVGMGFDTLRWLAPVRPGDTLTVEREVVAVDHLPENPKRGTVKSRLSIRNQDGVTVLEMVVLTSIPKRQTAK